MKKEKVATKDTTTSQKRNKAASSQKRNTIAIISRMNQKRNVKANATTVSCLNCSYKSTPGHIRCHMKNVHGIANPKIIKCPICEKMFENLFILKRHGKSDCGKKLGNGDKNNCDEQKRRGLEDPNSINRNSIIDTSITETGDLEGEAEKLCCGKCSYKTINPTNMRFHMENVHGIRNPKKKVVNVNKKRSMTETKKGNIKLKKSLSMSIKRKATRMKTYGEKLSSCLKCSYQSKYLSHIRIHMKKMHRISNPKIAKCEFCATMFHNLFILKKHIKFSCKKSKRGAQFSKKRIQAGNKHELPGNNSVREPKLKVRSKKGPARVYNCRHCEMVCGSFLQLRLHKSKVHFKGGNSETEKYKCVECDFESKYTSSVRSHIKTVHKISNPKFHKCNSCGEMFHNLLELKSHGKGGFCANTKEEFVKILGHTKEKEWHYNCFKCPYHTEYKNCLKAHMRVRHQIRITGYFKCPTCREVYLEENRLNTHKCTSFQIGLAPNPGYKSLLQPNSCVYVCSLCDEAFDDKLEFNAHKYLQSCEKKSNSNIGKKIFGQPLLFPTITVNYLTTEQLEKFGCSIPIGNFQELEIIDIRSQISVKKEKAESTLMYLSCSYARCQETFSSKTAMDAHIFNIHNPPNVIKKCSANATFRNANILTTSDDESVISICSGNSTATNEDFFSENKQDYAPFSCPTFSQNGSQADYGYAPVTDLTEQSVHDENTQNIFETNSPSFQLATDSGNLNSDINLQSITVPANTVFYSEDAQADRNVYGDNGIDVYAIYDDDSLSDEDRYDDEVGEEEMIVNNGDTEIVDICRSFVEEDSNDHVTIKVETLCHDIDVDSD